jgi:hypothetical protein
VGGGREIKTMAIQTCFLTDGNELFASATLVVPDELEEMNEAAMEASDGIFFWVKGTPSIVELPKAKTFRHIIS